MKTVQTSFLCGMEFVLFWYENSCVVNTIIYIYIYTHTYMNTAIFLYECRYNNYSVNFIVLLRVGKLDRGPYCKGRRATSAHRRCRVAI